MSVGATSTCPHCGAANPVGSTFCSECGKAILIANATGPRVVTAQTAGASATSRTLLADELQKNLKKASSALLIVAVAQAIIGPLMLMMMLNQARSSAAPGMVYEIPPTAWALVLGVAVAFFGLWFWSRYQPFVAAIVGLVLYISIWALDVVADPTMIFKGIILKIIIISMLVKAIKAGAEFRKLQEQQATETGGMAV